MSRTDGLKRLKWEWKVVGARSPRSVYKSYFRRINTILIVALCWISTNRIIYIKSFRNCRPLMSLKTNVPPLPQHPFDPCWPKITVITSDLSSRNLASILTPWCPKYSLPGATAEILYLPDLGMSSDWNPGNGHCNPPGLMRNPLENIFSWFRKMILLQVKF